MSLTQGMGAPTRMNTVKGDADDLFCRGIR
jgi:hypothetical protein